MATDKLHKVRFLLDHCRKTFQQEYIPHKQVSVDEAMIPFKGRLGIKQYMKDKPVRFGIKVWVLADAVTAYCYNFDVYIGKNADVVKNNLGLSSKVVIELAKPLEMKGYQVYTDNFYTSPQLVDYLYGRNTYLCGTVRTNRKGYPKDLVQTSAAGGCALYNAYIIEGTVVNHFPPNKQKRDLLSFWMDVTHELTGGFQTSSYVKVGTFSFPLIPSLLKYRYYFKSYECLNNWPIYKQISLKLLSVEGYLVLTITYC